MIIPEKPSIPNELQDSRVVIVAWMSLDGDLLSANRGFKHLIHKSILHKKEVDISEQLKNVSDFFIQPTFADLIDLVQNDFDNIYRGIFTIGLHNGISRGLTGYIKYWDGVLYLIAEYDVDEMENLQYSVLNLNDSLAQAQKKLAYFNKNLENIVQDRTKELEDALDVTEKIRNNLRISVQDKDDILDAIVDGIITIDETGIILSFNAGAEKLFQHTSVEVIGKNIKMLMPNSFSEYHDDYISNYLNSGIQKIIGIGRNVIALRKDQSVFPMHLSVAEMSLTGNDKRRFVGSCVDLTELQKQQDILRRSQKMDALGMLTGGVAHDFNNILGVVLGYSELIVNSATPSSKISNYADSIYQSAKRGSKLTKKLLAFTRKLPSDSTSVDVNHLLVDSRHLLEKTLTPRIDFQLILAPHLWSVYLDKGDFDYAIINMCINAMHAVDGFGTVSLETANKVINQFESMSLGISPGDYVVLKIVDSGTGMDDETKDQVFDPFFTTKGDKGTGLGLSQVFGFVKRSNGAINIESKVGIGTTINLYFPRVENTKNLSEDLGNKPDHDLTGTETLLVVDDEILMLELNKELLVQQGYRVFTADSAEKALSILKNESINLMLSDVMMPLINGYQLASIVKSKYPHVKIQLVSGFTESISADEIDIELQNNLIQKPFQSVVLLKRLRELL